MGKCSVRTSLLRKVSSLRYSIVEADAVGCENLFYFALFKLLSVPDGENMVTEIDTTEKF